MDLELSHMHLARQRARAAAKPGLRKRRFGVLVGLKYKEVLQFQIQYAMRYLPRARAANIQTQHYEAVQLSLLAHCLSPSSRGCTLAGLVAHHNPMPIGARDRGRHRSTRHNGTHGAQSK